MIHRLDAGCFGKKIVCSVIGCGGNGSQMLTGLARLDHALRALGQEGLYVHAIDPDHVSPANVGRQLFSPADVGRNKAEVLITRINAFYGTGWEASPRAFRSMDARVHFLITCIDTRLGRAIINDSITRRHGFSGYIKPHYWMDLGNRAEDGQVIIGQPAAGREWKRKKDRLPTVAELLPEIIKPGREDNTPSCSLAEALEKQHLFVNQAVTTAALQILWQLLRAGVIDWHGAFINLKTGRTTPLPVDPQAWERMRTPTKASPKRKEKS